MGGRNSTFAWVVGVLSAALIVGLIVLALPLLPVWTQLAGPAPTASATFEPERAAVPGEPRACRDLYTTALWGSIDLAASDDVRESQDEPASSIPEIVTELAPTVRFTCDWSSPGGTITTTYADAAADTARLLQGALDDTDFACEELGERLRCTRSDGDVIETIEVGDGRWLSSMQTGWQPTGYAGVTGNAVWAVSLGE